MRRVAPLLVLAVGLLLGEGVAHAQSNYGSTPLGGRSALMGNTGVALAKDGSAPFLNPATIVRIDDAKFAFSVNMYSASISSYSNWHAPGPLDQKRYGTLAQDQTSETQGRLDALPSTLCFFFTLRGLGQTIGEDHEREDAQHRKGRQKLAACLGTTDRGAVDYPALNFHSAGNTVAQAQSFTRNWSRFQVGPTWSAYLTDDLAVGISFHGAYTQYEAYLSSSNIGTDVSGHPTVASYSASANAHALDLAAIIGMTYRLGRGTHLGASLQTRAGSIFGSYSANEFGSFQGSAAQVSLARGDFAAPVPYRLSLGLGEEWTRVRVETNVSVYAPSNPSLSANIHADDTITDGNTVRVRPRDFTVGLNANAVVNAAMGFEYGVSRDLSVLGGLATDFSAGDRLSPVTLPALGTFTESREHRAIMSTGLASHGNTAEILFGFQFGYGWGKAYAVDSLVQPSSLGVVDVRNYSAIAIIGGSADLRAIEDAVKGVERAVVPKIK